MDPASYRMARCLVLCLILSLAACHGAPPSLRYENDPALAEVVARDAPSYPPVTWVVVSDPHWFDPSLGAEGPAFERYLGDDRKMLKEGPELFEEVVRALAQIPADFVLISGDLTKDGEAQSHAAIAGALRRVEAQAKKVFVVPGNHDILNGRAVRYSGADTIAVPSIDPQAFVDVYGEFGYREAVARDPASLSYIAEPEPGLWLLALDTCRYMENQPAQEPITAGRLSEATLGWMETMLARSVRESKAVIAMAHHGVVEHFAGQTHDFGAYVVEDRERVSRLLGMYGVRLVFTGHYHAQDVTQARWSERKFLFDVETGSLVTYPMPYRHVQVMADQMAIVRTLHVAAIPSVPNGFVEQARESTRVGIVGIATGTLMEYRIGLYEAQQLATQVGEAYLAHYAGDERLPAGQETIRTQGLSLPARLVVWYRKSLLDSLWNDLPPPDNDLTINLRTGESD